MTQRKAPLVSVIVPCFNAEKTLSAALDSAIAQAAEVPLEIILINDGSRDGTGRLMERYASDFQDSQGRRAGASTSGDGGIWVEAGAGDCKNTGFGQPAVGLTGIRIIRHEKSRGAAAGRNEGVAAAAGRYVAFLDADDLWAEGKLKAQVSVMETGFTGGEPSLCCTARELMTPAGELTGRVIPVKERISYRELLKHNSINCSSVLLRTDIARAFPMAHEDSHEDYITWMKIVRQHGPAAGINEPYLKYRLTGSGKSGSKWKSAKMTYTAYRYAGFGRCRAALLFARYALHGVWKYARA